MLKLVRHLYKALETTKRGLDEFANRRVSRGLHRPAIRSHLDLSAVHLEALLDEHSALLVHDQTCEVTGRGELKRLVSRFWHTDRVACEWFPCWIDGQPPSKGALFGLLDLEIGIGFCSLH